MSIQNKIQTVRLWSSVWIPLVVFFLPLGLMILAAYLNHFYAVRVGQDVGFEGVRLESMGVVIIATGLILFAYPFAESFFKTDGTLDDFEKKALLGVKIVGIGPYVIVISMDAINKIMAGTLLSFETFFDIGQVVMTCGFEYAAGILALPMRKVLFPESSGKKSDDKLDKPKPEDKALDLDKAKEPNAPPPPRSGAS